MSPAESLLPAREVMTSSVFSTFMWPAAVACASLMITDAPVAEPNIIAMSGKASVLHVTSKSNWNSRNVTGDHAMEVSHVQAIAAVASIIEGPVALSAPLMSSGLDSLGAVELRRELSAISGQDLPATLVFDYPTIDSMADFITSQLPPSLAPILPNHSALQSTAQQSAEGTAAPPPAVTLTSVRGAITAPMEDQGELLAHYRSSSCLAVWPGWQKMY